MTNLAHPSFTENASKHSLVTELLLNLLQHEKRISNVIPFCNKYYNYNIPRQLPFQLLVYYYIKCKILLFLTMLLEHQLFEELYYFSYLSN